jgi:hypothetical protein
MGMKKERNEDGRRCKKSLPCLLVVLFVVGTFIAPVAAKKGGDNSLKIIDEKLEAIDDNSQLNTFAYNIMLEYDNSPETNNLTAIKIVIIEGRWGRWRPREVKTFYVVRNDTGNCIDIVKTYAGDDDKLWTFYPNIGQSISALNNIASCFENCDCTRKHIAVRKLINLGIIAIRIDKDDTVPSITEIINNSPWASSYLPPWAQDFLERFKKRH